ncbi:MAG: hypothetical protein QOE58_3448 [Actinomycetota bacterium]|nr:hypothetical protein [Actinomycetota bacterium]
MGFFGTYQFDGTAWAESDASAEPTGPGPWLWVGIHDSDFATVRYAPAGSGSGIAFLNLTPRIYFESDDASAPTDIDREARGLADWWADRNEGASGSEKVTKQGEIASLLASDVEPANDDPMDDADTFAEMKAARLLSVMGLPLPKDLTGQSA